MRHELKYKPGQLVTIHKKVYRISKADNRWAVGTYTRYASGCSTCFRVNGEDCPCRTRGIGMLATHVNICLRTYENCYPKIVK